jgi:hypothetical protein
MPNHKGMETTKKTAMKGGEFLIKETNANDIFIPEQYTEEQKMIAQSRFAGRRFNG